MPFIKLGAINNFLGERMFLNEEDHEEENGQAATRQDDQGKQVSENREGKNSEDKKTISVDSALL